MSNNSEKFDGEMTIVVDRPLDSEDPKSPILNTVIDAQTGEKAILGEGLLEFLALMEELKCLTSKSKYSKNTKTHIHQKNLEANAWLEFFVENKLLSYKVLELLIEGRMKVGLWIDSVGGEVMLEDKVKWALDYLDRQGAMVNSYVGVKAASSAFDLAFLGDTIHALDRSVFMWHFSDSPESPRIKKVKQLKGHAKKSASMKEEFADFLAILDRANPESKDQLISFVLKQINHSKNPEGEVFLEGEYAADHGLINKAHSSIDSFVEQFASDFPLHADRNIAFFSTGVARMVHDVLNSRTDWLGNNSLNITTKIIDRLENAS